MEAVKLISALRKATRELDGMVSVDVQFVSRAGRRCSVGAVVLERDIEIVVHNADAPAIERQPPIIVLYETLDQTSEG